MKYIFIGLVTLVSTSSFAGDCTAMVDTAVKDMNILNEAVSQERKLEETLRRAQESGSDTKREEFQLEDFRRSDLAKAKERAQSSTEEAIGCLNEKS